MDGLIRVIHSLNALQLCCCCCCCCPPFVFPAAAQFMEGLIREFPVIEVSIRTSSRKLRSVLDVFYQVGGVVISQQQQQQQQ
jgi:hypothetical protein